MSKMIGITIINDLHKYCTWRAVASVASQARAQKIMLFQLAGTGPMLHTAKTRPLSLR